LELGRRQVLGHRFFFAIDKTAKSIGAFDSINYGVYEQPTE